MPNRTVTRLFASWPLLAAVVLAAALAVPAPARAATPAEVDAAIQKAKAYLRSQQKPDGSWEAGEISTGTQFGGLTAIATYALLAGGDNPQEPHVKKAVEWLAKAEIKGVYALGLRAQVWPFLKKSVDVRAMIARDGDLLLKSADKFGRWGYTTAGGGEHNSPTQYGVLGLWACAQQGFEVPNGFWQASEQGWFACQSPVDGGWQYRSELPNAERPSSPSMTAAGLASLYIAQDYLRVGEGARCRGNVTNPRIEAGLKWMSDHYPAGTTDGYLLYGIERIGVASGRKYFGPHDWYAIGSERLVKAQQPDGSWRYGAEGVQRVPGASFGIFFLSRGRAPIVMNKLQYAFELPQGKKKPSAADVANWNQRPRDVANVTRWMSESMERDLNWQVVDLSANAGDLLDAPLLYVTGDQVLRLGDADKKKLKSYVEQGGIILGQADCGKAAFSTSFRALGRELFPGYDFRLLPKTHPVYTAQFDASRWKGGAASVEGLSNGVRELMLLIPREDVSRSWQLRETSSRRHHFELASNIFLYAVDKSNLRVKGETYVLRPDPKAQPRRTIKLARIQYDGNWDPEPGGWRRMKTYLLNTFKLGLQIDPVVLGGEEKPAEPVAVNGRSGNGASGAAAAERPTPRAEAKGTLAKQSPSNDPQAKGLQRKESESKAPQAKGPLAKNNADTKVAEPTPAAVESLKGYDVAHWTGTAAVELNDAARNEIRTFVESGGTLVVDAAGGSTAFADSVEAELFKMFKNETPQLAKPLPGGHAVYALPASKLADVSFRAFARERLGNAARNPRVRAITLKDRAAIFFSKEDFTAGLVGQPVDGVLGYDPRTATPLVANLLLYATGEGKAAPPPAKAEKKPAAKAPAARVVKPPAPAKP